MSLFPSSPEPRSADYFMAHMFLSDVLAGEFSVPPVGTRHTMGRLMAAAYLKGEAGNLDPEEREQIDGPGEINVFRYRPSWMPESVASTYVRTEPRIPRMPMLTGVRVESAYAVGLHIAQHECGLMIVRPGEASNQEMMELGPGLQRQRQTIAELAGEFFAQIYTATHQK